MLSTTFSTTVALPAQEADELLREYSYRRIIGHHQAPDGAMVWHPSDDVAMSGRVEIYSLGPSETRVDLRVRYETDELAVTRRYTRYLDGFKQFAEASRGGVSTETTRVREAA